jgi:hypothetical protein
MSSVFRAGLLGLAFICAAAAQDITPGRYEGTVQSPNGDAKIILDLDKNAKQEWIGELSMSQGPRQLPLAQIAIQGTNISFQLAVPGQSPKFSGSYDPAAKAIKGNISGPNGEVPFEVTRTGDAKITAAAPSSPITPEMIGTWEGTLQVGGRSMRLQVILRQGADGKAAGDLVSLDQGAQKIPITTITQDGTKLELVVRLVGVNFKGAMNEAKTEITGDWTQGPRTLPLTLKKAGTAADAR